MGTGRRFVDRYVFFYYECTYEESFWDKWERLMRSFPFLFYRECSNENYMIKKKNQEYVDRNNETVYTNK